MPAKPVSITLDREMRSIVPGAAHGRDIISLAKVADNEQVFLEVEGDVDIPLGPDDIIFIRGGESFSIGDGQPRIEDNPAIRKPVDFLLNDQPPPQDTRPVRAKVTGRELKALTGAVEVDLWVDLDGIADELVEDADRVVLQPRDHYFTVARVHEDRFYDVTVLLDGEAAARRFPAGMTVVEAMRRSLPPRDRAEVGKFDMVDSDVGTTPLAPELTLKSAGVRDGHTLSITKKNGGGG